MLDRLKRVLRPARPVLLPAWRLVQPVLEGRGRWPGLLLISQISMDAVGSRVGPALSRRPIRPLTRREFDLVALRHPYYRARWSYMSVACDAARDLIERCNLRSALELGPHLRPVIVGADVMDRREEPDLKAEGRLILHDATSTPWPVGDRAYDLFVALQVFEHLGSAQHDAFCEVRRVARHAIISLPIDWEMADPRNVHHRISEEKALSWFAPVVPTRILLGNPGPKKRLVFVFENLEPAPAGNPTS